MTFMIRTFDVFPVQELVRAYKLYEAAFTPLAHLAANRHLMTYDEHNHVMNDKRVTKVAVYDLDENIVGMSTITQQLDAMPLVSPQFFQHRWPEEYAAGLIWYVGYMATDNNPRAFREMLFTLSEDARNRGGMVFMDFCTENVDRGLPESAERILGRRAWSLHVREVDAQAFYLFSFLTPEQAEEKGYYR